jgi:hypothetical protein
MDHFHDQPRVLTLDHDGGHAARDRTTGDVLWLNGPPERFHHSAEALQSIKPGDILQVSSLQPVASQLMAFSSGWRPGYECVVGKLCITPEQVTECKLAEQHSIFVKNSITASDFETILAASGLVTCAESNLTFAAAIAHLFRKSAAIDCADI